MDRRETEEVKVLDRIVELRDLDNDLEVEGINDIF